MSESAPPAPTSPPKAPWHATFPPPTSPPTWLPASTLLTTLRSPTFLPGHTLLLIDLRRLDHEGGTIRGSINLPAQSLWWSLPAVYELAKRAGGMAVFYCGSSTGRGSRGAGWLQDYAIKVAQEKGLEAPEVTVYALEGGVRGWANAGPEYVEYMEGYNEQYWKEGGKCAQ